MAALYGRLRAYTKDGASLGAETTRIAHGEIESVVETWGGAVTVQMFPDGTFNVLVGPKHGRGELVLSGNADDMLWEVA